MTDNSLKIKAEIQEKIAIMLEEIGQRAVGHARENAPVGTPESTGIENYHGGMLRQSLTYKVIGNTVYIGTNLTSNKAPYPIFVEYGTGIFAINGRKTPWVWTDKNGKRHYTHGIKPTHFLRNAIDDNKSEYINVIRKYFND
ncbi:MAG: HK97 gp10 family phage protein [Ruminococcus sp.]|nr:HK97 gp10 family phage protein [Ruminococcus sp.]